MNNKYLYMVVGAIVVVVWFYTGRSAYYSGGSTSISDSWWLAMVLAVGLGAGSTGGDNVVSIFVEAIKGYVPTLILLAIVAVVGHTLYILVVMRATPEIVDVVRAVVTFMVCGFLTNMMLSYLRKSIA